MKLKKKRLGSDTWEEEYLLLAEEDEEDDDDEDDDFEDLEDVDELAELEWDDGELWNDFLDVDEDGEQNEDVITF